MNVPAVGSVVSFPCAIKKESAVNMAAPYCTTRFAGAFGAATKTIAGVVAQTMLEKGDSPALFPAWTW